MSPSIPTGPREWILLVLMPTSAPLPNLYPSANLEEALMKTSAESTDLANTAAFLLSEVIMTSVWRELCRRPAGRAVSRLTEMAPLRQDDETRTQLLEGRSGKLALWRHAVTLAPLGDDRTECTDQVELDAGKLNAAAKPLAELYLKLLQVQRANGMKNY